MNRAIIRELSLIQRTIKVCVHLSARLWILNTFPHAELMTASVAMVNHVTMPIRLGILYALFKSYIVIILINLIVAFFLHILDVNKSTGLIRLNYKSCIMGKKNHHAMYCLTYPFCQIIWFWRFIRPKHEFGLFRGDYCRSGYNKP